MDFDPSVSNEQDRSPKLVDPGEYDLLVREAEERVSTKGNPMIALELIPDGYPGHIIREYLVATSAAMFKVRQFCEAAGLSKQFESGRLTENDCRGVKVRARIVVEEGTDQFPDKNRVDEFIAGRANAGTSAGNAGHSPISEDDIPF